jgi:light-regulated signal transduction histidine kinase (bacteriophytochrome)
VVQRALETGDAIAEIPDLTAAGGARRAMILHASRLHGPGGSALVLVLIDDVTDRRTIDASLAADRRELERSNSALAGFANAASHDLQEPLRKIVAFASRIVDRHGGTLTPDALDYLGRISKAAVRMRTLMDALLETARASAEPPVFTPVDLNGVVADVLHDLDMRIGERDVAMEVGQLPTIDANPFQMRQLLQNLIANALKFHRPEGVVAVSVTATVADNVVQIRIRDNGIGFAEQYRERIFGIFMRLHARSVYEGSGIGLSLCRTIAERHGGTISAESTPGEGSMFTVTLPVHRLAATGTNT